MDNNHANVSANNGNDDINLKELFTVLWNGKWIVIFFVSIFSIVAILFTLSLPNIYQSKALLNPVSEQSNLNQSLSSFGGLASLAGFDMPTNGSNAIKAQEKLKSLSFFEDNILPNIYLPDLIAVKSWEVASNSIIYDENIYDKSNEKWVREFQYPQTLIPSSQESFKVFSKKLSITEDKNTGFVTIAIEHQSPYVAKKWTELIVNQINYFFRVKDKAEAQVAMDYLNIQIAKTSFSEIKQVIAQILQEKMQQLALIEATDYYVFEYIDPPAVMEDKSAPSRSIICIMAAFFGGFLGMLLVLIRNYFFKKYQR